MADYWKSQAKKFCDFCKCWIADNKPSIGFHEAGKRHKENVAKRLSEISKSSAKSFKESQQVDHDMKRMEQEALKAYMKDLQENPDYTSRRIVEETERRKQELEESVRRKAEVLDEPKTEEPPAEPKSTTRKVWYEAKSDEGYTYYWHIDTAKAIWEAPEEGYVSIEEQEKKKKEIEEKKEIKRRKKEEKAKKKQEALKERENLQKKRKNDEDNEDDITAAVGPAPKPDPYGAWETIEHKVEEPLDLELPQQEFVAIRVPDLTEPEVKFKEKTIATLEESTYGVGFIKEEPGGSPANFKKRKFNRGNVRQKLDTD